VIIVDTALLMAAALSELVDASVVALAEQLGIQEIATLDRRHSSGVRPHHVNAFTLLP